MSLGTSGVFDLSDPKQKASINGQTIAGPTTLYLGDHSENQIKSAYSTGVSGLAAGYDAQNRQRYIDQATTNAKIQQQNQIGAAERSSAIQGKRYISSPSQMINSAANLAAAGTQAGWKADEDNFTKRMQVADLGMKENEFNQNSANAWNQTSLGWANVGLKQQELNNQQNALSRSKSSGNSEAQGYNNYNNYHPSAGSTFGTDFGSSDMSSGLTSKQYAGNPSVAGMSSSDFGNPYLGVYQ